MLLSHPACNGQYPKEADNSCIHSFQMSLNVWVKYYSHFAYYMKALNNWFQLTSINSGLLPHT